MPTEEVSLLLKGEPGSKVKLEYKRPGLGPVQTCELTRKVVLLRDVPLGMTLDDKAGIGYVQLKGFSTTAPAELAYVIGQLQSNGPLKTLVLDLRGNPGGLLSSAIKVWTWRAHGSEAGWHVAVCRLCMRRVSAVARMRMRVRMRVRERVHAHFLFFSGLAGRRSVHAHACAT